MKLSVIESQITAYEAQIAAYNAAILALTAANGVQSYSLNTGQSTQSVTRTDLPSLQESLSKLLAAYQDMCALYKNIKGNSVVVRPAF